MLKVQPLNKIKKPKRTITAPLPDPRSEEPFIMLISAKCGSGKSVLISNLIRNENMYYKYFDKVYFCSSNVNEGKIYDQAYKDKIFINESRLYDSFDEDIMEEIVDDIKNDEDFDESHYLLVIDDLPTELNKKTSKIVKRLIKHRHLHLSIIVSTQKINLLNLALRNITSHLIIFKTNNANERESMATMTELNKNDFYDLLDYATEEKFNFLFVDLSKNPTEFFKNFEEKIL